MRFEHEKNLSFALIDLEGGIISASKHFWSTIDDNKTNNKEVETADDLSQEFKNYLQKLFKFSLLINEIIEQLKDNNHREIYDDLMVLA